MTFEFECAELCGAMERITAPDVLDACDQVESLGWRRTDEGSPVEHRCGSCVVRLNKQWPRPCYYCGEPVHREKQWHWQNEALGDVVHDDCARSRPASTADSSKGG